MKYRNSFIVTAAIALLLWITATGCNQDEMVWMVYEETQCSDPWILIEENTTEEKVVTYLNEKGVKIYKIEIVNYSQGPFCLACPCPSGDNIRVNVDISSKDVLLDLGFTE